MLSRPAAIALIGFAAAAIAAALALSLDRDEPAELPPPQVVGVLPIAPRPMGVTLPAIDIVRIGATGDVMIAGRAVPHAELSLVDRAGGEERDIGRSLADTHGEWVFVPELPFTPGARLLSVRAANPDGSFARGEAEVVLVVPEPGRGTPLALRVAAAAASLVLQGPADAGLLVVDRDGEGRLFVGGRAAVGATIHLYLDHRFIGRARADGEVGVWGLAARAPRDGPHLLRADHVDSHGTVVTRSEREWRSVPDILPGTVALDVRMEPGGWRIVRRGPAGGSVNTLVYTAR